MGSLPSGSVDVATVAMPFDSVEVPNVVAPLVNVTVPFTDVGRVSVKVTEAPGNDGFTEEVKADTGDALATVCVVVPVAEV
jgi:hypothetical protein